MGEYAMFGGERVKIGTCEDMYYLRHDQRTQVRHVSGNVDPVRQADSLRFRFPWPDEDGAEPGAFDGAHDRAVGVDGITPPAEVEHGLVQFVASAGYLVSLPCPEGGGATPGLSTTRDGMKFHRNGFKGAVLISSQRPQGDMLLLVARCGGCGAAWRYEAADVAPVVAALRERAGRERDEERRRFPDARGGGDWYDTVADRIEAGYVAQVRS